ALLLRRGHPRAERLRASAVADCRGEALDVARGVEAEPQAAHGVGCAGHRREAGARLGRAVRTPRIPHTMTGGHAARSPTLRRVTTGRRVATTLRRTIGVAAATALLAASCTGSSDPAPTPSTSPPNVVMRLRVRHAHFSLPTPVSREAATAWNGAVYLAGGLLANQSSA